MFFIEIREAKYDAFWKEHENKNQYGTKTDDIVLFDGMQELIQNRQNRGPKKRTPDAAHSSHNYHRHDLDRIYKGEGVRAHKVNVMGI